MTPLKILNNVWVTLSLDLTKLEGWLLKKTGFFLATSTWFWPEHFLLFAVNIMVDSPRGNLAQKGCCCWEERRGLDTVTELSFKNNENTD